MIEKSEKLSGGFVQWVFLDYPFGSAQGACLADSLRRVLENRNRMCSDAIKLSICRVG